MKKMNKKGFTLAELLIVVAIIAVLVAIAIPVFTTQLEKSREAVDVSNIRAIYAEVASEVLTAPSSVTGYSKAIGALKQTTTTGWVIDAGDVAGYNLGAVTPSDCVYVNVAADGTFTVTKTPTYDELT